MANLKEKISSLFPGATIEELDTLRITISPAELHALAKALKEDSESPFDFLMTIVGMDWTESLGCVYYLSSTKTKDII